MNRFIVIVLFNLSYNYSQYILTFFSIVDKKEKEPKIALLDSFSFC